METPRGFARSSIGRKVVMAATGAILVVFVIGHMLGNLQVYLGPEAMNNYAVFLRQVLHGTGLWIARVTLLAAVILHIWAATSLTLTSRRARAIGYRKQQWKESTYASRTMRWGGVTILAFLTWHLLNFTIVKVNPAGGATDNPYTLMVDTFDLWWMTLIYLVAMAALALHLHHGTWSALQTLGLTGTAAARQRAKKSAIAASLAWTGDGGSCAAT